jgi:hypothetical protein
MLPIKDIHRMMCFTYSFPLHLGVKKLISFFLHLLALYCIFSSTLMIFGRFHLRSYIDQQGRLSGFFPNFFV